MDMWWSKATNSTDKILIIDPKTGIVRDILLNSTIFGAYCYYDLQTELAVDLGESLLSANCDWFTFLSGLVTTMGIGMLNEYKNSIGGDVPPDDKKLILGLIMTVMGGYGQYYFSEFHTNPNFETATQLGVDYIFSIIGVKLPVQFSGVRVTTGYIDIGLLYGAESYIVPFTTVEFFEYGTSMGILKVFGQTPKEVVLKIANEYFNGEIRSLIINTIFWSVDETSKLIPQYNSTYYNNSTEYLTTP